MLEKLNNSIFEALIIAQNSNIINWGTTSAKSINLLHIRKLNGYPIKSGYVKTVVQILLFKNKSVLRFVNRVPGSASVKFSVKKQKIVHFFMDLP